MAIKNKTVLQHVAKEMKMSVKKLDTTIALLMDKMIEEGYKDLLSRRNEAQLHEPRDINESSPIINKGVGTFRLRSRKGASEVKGEFALNYFGKNEGYESFWLALDDNQDATTAIIARIDAEIDAENGKV